MLDFYEVIDFSTISIAPLFLRLSEVGSLKPMYPRWLSPSRAIVHTKPNGVGYLKLYIIGMLFLRFSCNSLVSKCAQFIHCTKPPLSYPNFCRHPSWTS